MVSAAPPDPGEELEYAELDFGDGCMLSTYESLSTLQMVST